MAFCEYSTEYIASSKTEVDNIFINDYLPYAEAQFVKVYLYGLYKCNDASSADNSLDKFAKQLNMSEEDVLGAFEYWEEQGLVKIIKAKPIFIRYIPLRNVISSTKLYNKDKYESFNKQAEEIFKGHRTFTPNEYFEYYDFLERYHMEQEALLMIMRYCVESKARGVGYHYILTVARNWASEGLLTADAVENRIMGLEEKTPYITTLFKTVGISRRPYIEENSLLNKWLVDYGFNLDVVLYIAKFLKKKNRFSMERLDTNLTKYYQMKCMSIMEIEEHEKNKNKKYDLAKSINRGLGVYYDSLDNEIDTYITDWLNLGFDENALIETASYCFTHNIRSLEGMNKTVKKFFKFGLLTVDALHTHLNILCAEDEEIKKILQSLGIDREVGYLDRENYKTWTKTWETPIELIDYASTLAKGKDGPLKYLSRILSDWHTKGIKTIDEAKKTTIIPNINSMYKPDFAGKSYSKEQINALFQSIEDVEI